MWFRIVTTTLALALGAWSGGIAFAQAQGEGAQEDILDFFAPARDFDRTLQSELPLQGIFDDPMIQGSIAESSSLQSPATAPDGGWIDASGTGCTTRRVARSRWLRLDCLPCP